MKRKALGLFATFFKIGAFTFGGGYAMIPLIQREIVDKKQWATNEDLLDIIAIAESTPGPIAVNAATFIGSKIDGFFGALFATLGVVLPSFITIFAVSFAIAQFEHIKLVQYAFTGIRAAVQCSLSAKCQQDAVGTFFLDNLFYEISSYGKEIHFIGNAFRSLNGCDVRVYQY